MYYILHSNHSPLPVDDSTTVGSRDSRQPQIGSTLSKTPPAYTLFNLHRRIPCSVETTSYSATAYLCAESRSSSLLFLSATSLANETLAGGCSPVGQ